MRCREWVHRRRFVWKISPIYVSPRNNTRTKYLHTHTNIRKKKHTCRSEYALAGDVVNLAARLAAASEKGGGGVLCDETTIASLTGEVSVTDTRSAVDTLELINRSD